MVRFSSPRSRLAAALSVCAAAMAVAAGCAQSVHPQSNPPALTPAPPPRSGPKPSARPAPAGAVTPVTSATLDAAVKAEIAAVKGNVWVYAKNLDTGATYSLRGDERVRTASTIKLPILVALYAEVADGRARWDQELVVTKEKKVPGSGVLTEFADGTKITLRDAANLMIVVSDNTATNLVLDVVSADTVNARMDALGLTKTRAVRKIGGGSPSKVNDDPVWRLYGLGISTPREMVTLLERLERGEIVSAAASKEMIETLKREQYGDAIGRTLYDVPVARKLGALDRLRSDIGIVYSRRGRIAMAITVDDMPEVHYSPDNPGLILISRLSVLLMEGLAMAETPVPSVH
jgi:beta-lactamase class A